jgi:hypothetical protein
MADKTKGHAGAATTPKGKASSMTKSEALRKAIGQLGKDSKPLQLQAHIKQQFGIEMSTDHISSSKTDIIRKMSSGAKPAAAKSAAPKPVPATPTTPTLSAPKPAVAKPAAPKPVPAKPTVAKPAAQVTVAPKPAVKKPVVKKPAAPKSQPKPTSALANTAKASDSVALTDVAAVKALVGRVGPTNLKALIDVLAN